MSSQASQPAIIRQQRVRVGRARYRVSRDDALTALAAFTTFGQTGNQAARPGSSVAALVSDATEYETWSPVTLNMEPAPGLVAPTTAPTVAEAEAEERLQTAEEQAAASRLAAYQEGLRAGREAGFEVGLQEGRAAGEAAGYSAGADEVRETLQAARRIVSEARRWRADLILASESSIIDLVNQVARKLFGDGFILPAEQLHGAVTATLEHARNLTNARIHLHPTDVDKLESLWPHDDIALVPDESVKPGGSRIVGDEGVVDGTVDVQLERVAESLAAAAQAA